MIKENNCLENKILFEGFILPNPDIVIGPELSQIELQFFLLTQSESNSLFFH